MLLPGLGPAPDSQAWGLRGFFQYKSRRAVSRGESALFLSKGLTSRSNRLRASFRILWAREDTVIDGDSAAPPSPRSWGQPATSLPAHILPHPSGAVGPGWGSSAGSWGPHLPDLGGSDFWALLAPPCLLCPPPEVSTCCRRSWDSLVLMKIKPLADNQPENNQRGHPTSHRLCENAIALRNT